MTTHGQRVLMAWEHGRNLGHVARLTAVAQQFEQAGAEIVWALPAGRAASLAPASQARAVVRTSPRIESRNAHRCEAPHSFADILVALGFADRERLRSAVIEWIKLFEAERIDRVVLDYAPAAQLAALVAGVPACQVTNGFDAPPLDCPLFDIGVRGPMLEQRNRARLDALDRSFAAAGRALGPSRQLSLARWLAYPRRWYDCIAETDPYGPRDDGVYVGPIGRPPERVRIAWPTVPRPSKKVFMYLRSGEQVEAVLGALPGGGVQVLCAWPGVTNAEAEKHRRENVTIVGEPVDLDSVLPQADLVLNYGSTTFVCQTLLAGKPQLMLPTDAEKWLVARRVHAQGAGIALPGRATIDEVRSSLACLRERSIRLTTGTQDLSLSSRLPAEIASCMGTMKMETTSLSEARET